MLEGFNVNISGHVLIKDDEGNVYLDKHNAVHPQNMSRIIARALSNEPNSIIYRMAFGNGGTVTDPTNKVILNPTNDGTVSGWEARLYNETYSEVVDESSTQFGFDIGSAEEGNIRVGSQGASPTAGDPDGGVVSQEVGIKSNVVVSVYLSKEEPTGQLGAFTDFGVAVDDSERTFIFDEIGLYSPGKPAAATPASTSVDVGNKTSDDIFNNLAASTTYSLSYTVNGNAYATVFTTPAGGSGPGGTFTYGDFCEGLNSGSWSFTGQDITQYLKIYITDRSNGAYPSIVNEESYGLLTFKTLATGASNSVSLIDGGVGDVFTETAVGTINAVTTDGANAGVANDPSTPENERERLLTHIVFPPIAKTGDKALSIVYTLTVSVAKTKDSRILQTASPSSPAE